MGKGGPTVEVFDGIIIGGGHNSLTLGAYLSRAGLKVAVIERNPEIGGGCCTEEPTLPGFLHNLHSSFHVGLEEGPVYSDLSLDRYGLRYVYPPVQYGITFRDGACVLIHQDVEQTLKSFSRFSKKDAESYRGLHAKFAVEMKDLITSLIYSPPIPRSELPSRIRGRLGEEYLSYYNLTMNEAVDQHFEDEHIRVLFKLFLKANNVQDVPGSGLFFPRFFSRLTRSGLAVGGSVRLPLALGRVIEESAGVLIRNKHVERIWLKNGEARGVELSDGSRIESRKFVASGVDFPQTVRMAGEEYFGEEVVKKAMDWKWADHSLLGLHLCLQQSPRYRSANFDPAINEAYNLFFGAEDSEEIRKNSEEMENGEFPSFPMGNGACNSVHDPRYAPPGRHIAFWWPLAPYDLKPSGPQAWDEKKQECTERLLKAWRSYAPNLEEKNVLATFLFTPLDIERRCINMVRGSHHVGAYPLDQLGFFRPHEELSHYRTPVAGLYLCGSSSHVGGNVTASPGYNAANVIAEDLGLTRWWKPVPPPDFG